MQCPRCQAENREGARFCRDCGALASTRDAEDAPDYYREALALAGEFGMRPLVAHCHLGLGKLYAHTAKHEQAQEHLSTSTTMHGEMGMRFWLEQVEREQRAHDRGAQLHARRSSRSVSW